ncbi:MAG: serine--tRNA ligase, partial [Nitrososphaerota archaeon]|nr:serine--tRNA ligase [Nitrososphaerota archaeon]
MIDIKLVRESPDLVRANLAKRGNSESILLLDELVALDKQWRLNLTNLNDLRHARKMVTVEIATLKKAGQAAQIQLAKAKMLDVQISSLEKQVVQEEVRERNLLLCLPNMLDPTVPFGEDERGNVQVKAWGVIPTFDFPVKNHIDLANALGIVDMERAGKISGARFFFLKKQLALLDLALMSFAVQELSKKGYVVVEPPLMMNKEAYEGVTALADFADVLYKIEGEDLYMIATSEHPMAAMYMGEVLKEQDLPLKLAGLSACFRKEAGAHGKDTRGIFRTHQFNKIEQFVFCKPEDSVRLHEELLANAEDLLQKLELPYRVVNVCTGDIGTVAAKKY